MRFRKLLAAVTTAACVASAALAASGYARAEAPAMAEAWNAPAITWHSLQTGIPEATRTGKTVLMVFHAPWCTACAKFRAVFKDPRVVEAARDIVMILVDADADKTANGAFAPDGTYVPRTIFMTSDGEVRSDLTGKSDPKHPHAVDIEAPDELLALMLKAGADAQDEAGLAPDQRAAN
jgi:thiol:disulfide interchange protein